jgi:hypothetical protein
MLAYLARIIDTHDIVGFSMPKTWTNQSSQSTNVPIQSIANTSSSARGNLLGISSRRRATRGEGRSSEDANEPVKDLPWARVDLSESWFDAMDGRIDGEWVPFFPIHLAIRHPKRRADSRVRRK